MSIIDLITDLDKISSVEELIELSRQQASKMLLECKTIDDYKDSLRKVEDDERIIIKVYKENKKLFELLFMIAGYVRYRALSEIKRLVDDMSWNERAIYYILENKLLNISMTVKEYLKQDNRIIEQLIYELNNIEEPNNGSNWRTTKKLCREYDLILTSDGLKAI